MRWLFSLFVLYVFGIVATADDGATAKAKAALALAQLRREAPSNAKTKAADALAKCLTDREAKVLCLTDMHEAARIAARENKRLFFWVGMTCHEHMNVHAAFRDGVHVHVKSIHGSSEPRLLIGTAPGVTSHLFELPRSEITPERIRSVIGMPKKMLMDTSPAERQRMFVSTSTSVTANC